MYNQLTPEQAERLRILRDQCQRTIEHIDRIEAHGYSSFHPYMSGPDNRGKLEASLGDLSAVVSEMVRNRDIDDSEVLAHSYRRRLRIEETLRQQANPH